MTTEEKWVLVKSESELRPGMTVKMVRCRYCKATHIDVLIRKNVGRVLGTSEIMSGWVMSRRTCTNAKGSVFDLCVAERRLFRMETGESEKAQRREGEILYNLAPQAMRTRKVRI